MSTSGELELLQMVSEPDTERCATLGSQGVDYEILHWLERERNIPYKGVETSPVRHVLKIVRLTMIRSRPKRTISASGGLELLQMVSEPDIERCATVGPQGGGL